jgi:hypothetical protein
MAAVMKATSSARRKVAAASDVKIISYYLNNLKKHTQKDFIINDRIFLNEIVQGALFVLFVYVTLLLTITCSSI